MDNLETLFAAMNTAEGSNSGVFFTEGNYTVELKEVEYRPNGFKGRSVIFRFTVVESNTPEHPVQSTRVWINKLDKKKDDNVRTMADIKNLVFALLGTSAREVGSPEVNPKAHQQATQLFMAAIDETFAANHGLDQKALIGRKAKLEAIAIKTKAGGTYTKHVWDKVAA